MGMGFLLGVGGGNVLKLDSGGCCPLSKYSKNH